MTQTFLCLYIPSPLTNIKHYTYVTFIKVQSCFEAIDHFSQPSSCAWYLIYSTDSEIEALHISVILKCLITALNKTSKYCVVGVRFYTETAFVVRV